MIWIRLYLKEATFKNENGYTMFFLKHVRHYSFSVFTVLLLLVVGLAANAQKVTPEYYRQLKYRWIGPAGNRVIATCGVPGDNNICYVGAASRGIWKSIDGGINWDPVFDDADVSSVSALAIAPSDPNVVWAGTGETFVRNDISVGNGVYKSTDAGANWERMGLDHSGRIPRIIIHPTDFSTVYVAAMGHCHGPQKEKGGS